MSAHKQLKKNTTSWRLAAQVTSNAIGQTLKSGYLTLSPAYYGAGQVLCVHCSLNAVLINLQDGVKLTPSLTMHDVSVAEAHHITTKTETFIRAIVWLTHEHQYNASVSALDAICQSTNDKRIKNHLSSWPSIFSGHTWILNRSTPSHKDVKGFKSGYDYLSATGSAMADLSLPDIGITCTYNPGTLVALAGRVLSHKVDQVSEGNRISIARWVRSAILSRYGSNKGKDTLPWSTVADLERNISFLVSS
jgi:hypothetical protein